ncbi:MAG TPA: metallophosphoesterase [Deltaproteobacteria bacterium]|nr:metallophosphoesterase [Deltaproteobacteria bacterium]HQB39886.1 metallophosphoesterase [Deltaproteobacteria bacterium]
MNLFLLIFFLAYGAMHIYAYRRMTGCMPLTVTARNFWRITIVLASLSPSMVRLLEVHGHDRLALAVAWPGYIWMGFIFIFTVALVIMDLFRLAFKRANRNRYRNTPEILNRRLSFEVILLLSIVATAYGLYEARNIHTEQLTIRTAKVKVPVRVVQLSDVHLGLLTRENRLSAMLDVVRQARPDILVSTGDLLDGRLSRQEDGEGFLRVEAMLRGIEAPQGKFAVMGNHEYYAGEEHAVEVTTAAGFSMLRNGYAALPNGILIAGVDDVAWKRMKRPAQAVSELELLNSLPKDMFRIYLKHKPVVKPESIGLFDLQLSGHTHRGQILPFYLLTKFQFPLPGGTVKLPDGSYLHTSRGSGTWGPPIRLFAPPEITIIDIVPE